MIGDRMDTDVVSGLEAGLHTILVLTGIDHARGGRALSATGRRGSSTRSPTWSTSSAEPSSLYPSGLVERHALLDLPHHRRVDDQVAEGPDRRHVGVPEQPVRLHLDRHLAAIAAGPVRDPAEVHDPVDGPVGDLRGPLVVEQVERVEGKPRRSRAGRGVAQIGRQPVAERRHAGRRRRRPGRPSRAAPRASSGSPRAPGRPRGALRRVAGSEPLAPAAGSRPAPPASAAPRRPRAGSRG